MEEPIPDLSNRLESAREDAIARPPTQGQGEKQQRQDNRDTVNTVKQLRQRQIQHRQGPGIRSGKICIPGQIRIAGAM